MNCTLVPYVALWCLGLVLSGVSAWLDHTDIALGFALLSLVAGIAGTFATETDHDH